MRGAAPTPKGKLIPHSFFGNASIQSSTATPHHQHNQMHRTHTARPTVQHIHRTSRSPHTSTARPAHATSNLISTTLALFLISTHRHSLVPSSQPHLHSSSFSSSLQCRPDDGLEPATGGCSGGAISCPLRSGSRSTRRLPSLATLVQQGDTVAHLRHTSARLSLRCTCNRDSRTVVVWYLIYPYITTPRTRQEEGRLQRSCIGLLPTGRGALGW